jgi:hypothetical protein
MNIAYFPNQIAQNGQPVLTAFLQSCQYHGHKVVADSLDADMAVIWSQVWAGRMRDNQQVWESYRSTNRNVVVLEVGGIQRNTTWRVGLNGVNGTANFGTGPCHGNRAQQLGLQLLPWRQLGKYIVICTQRSDSEQWHGMPKLESWVDSTITTIKTHTDRPIIIRSHPRFRLKKQWADVGLQLPKHIVGTHDSFDFESSITDAWAVFNWNSNPGVQAVINGVPAFVGPNSLAAPVANLDWSLIENPLRPDREQWLNNLAWTEWTIEEIQQGIPLLRLMLA